MISAPLGDSFVHLHVHSEYSLLDGACRVDGLCRRSAEEGAPGIALTDHGVMFGAMEFYYTAREHSLVPIVGCEAYIAPRGRFDKTVRDEAHITLLAADLVGYRNLVALISKGFLEGYYYKPRIDMDLLAKHHDGLIVLSGCMSSLVAQPFLRNDPEGARKAARAFVDIFGDRFYIEIMRHGIPEQDIVNTGLIALAREMNVPLVATNDSHYLNRSDASAHDVLLCIQTGKTVADTSRMKFMTDEFYVKSSAEMRELFADVPDACDNTLAIAKRIDIKIPEKTFNIPHYPVPPRAEREHLHHAVRAASDRLEAARTARTVDVWTAGTTGLPGVDPAAPAEVFVTATEVVPAELAAEPSLFDVGPVHGVGFDSALARRLEVREPSAGGAAADFEHVGEAGASEDGRPDGEEGPGGDGAAISVVLEPAPPDEDESPDEYLREICAAGLIDRYGDERVATDAALRERLDYELGVILTMGFASYFLIVWDFIKFARDQGIPVGPGRGSAVGSLVSYALRITDMDPIKFDLIFERFLNPDRISMPDIDTDFCVERRDEVIKYVTEKYGSDRVAQIVTFGTMAARGAINDAGRALAIPLADCSRIAKMIPSGPQGLSIDKALQQIADLRAQYDQIPWVRTLIDTARSIEGLARNASTHAAGVVISKDPLVDWAPLVRLKDDDVNTQYDMNWVERIGLLKMDFLGLRNLTVMKNAVDEIHRTTDPVFDLDRIPDDDRATLEMLGRGETTGVFQLESDGMRRVVTELKPSTLDDIVALVALYRPGPMDWIPQYISNKHGRTVPTYLHPKLMPILGNTYGIAIFQEQVMRIARDIAGFTMGQADELRKVMGKKQKEKIPVYREKFVKGAVETSGITENLAGEIFAFVEPFAGYGFNKCAHGSTEIELPDGTRTTLAEAYRSRPQQVMAMWPDGEIRPHAVARIVKAGHKDLFRVRTVSGKSIEVTAEHRLLTTDGYREVAEMTCGTELITAPGRASRPPGDGHPIAKSAANARARYDTVSGFDESSIASNGMWCASAPERDMCEWLIARGISFEMHRTLQNGRVCDFYFDGIYWDMDGLDRTAGYFAAKYGDLPYVVVTPEDFQPAVVRHLGLAHATNGDPVVSIEPCGTAMTYDVEMAPNGPLNFIANRIVSHNSHAVAYGWIAYQTAFLKANHPRAYLAALMTSVKDKTDKLVEYVDEAKKVGIPVLPPDVNASLFDFTVVDEEIRFGLAAIKGVGEGGVRSIIDARSAGGVFEDVFDLVNRVDLRAVNRKVFEALVKCGALDTLPGNRAQKLDALDLAIDRANRAARDRESGQFSLFGEATATTESRPALRNLPAPAVLEQLGWEKETLGIFVSGHPLADVQEALVRGGATQVKDLKNVDDDAFVSVAGMLIAVRRTITKAQQQMLIAQIEDMSGSVECIVFPKSYPQLQGAFVQDAIVTIRGRVSRRERRGATPGDEAAIETSIQVNEVVPFVRSAPAQRANAWHVKATTRNEIDALARLLAESPGKIPVVIHSGEQAARMPRGISEGVYVRLELEAIFGRSGVWEAPL